MWHQCYNRELAPELSPAQQAIFETGQEVGRLATHPYPGGVLVEENHYHHTEAVQATLTAVNDPNIPAIFEAALHAYCSHDTLAMVEIREQLLRRF